MTTLSIRQSRNTGNKFRASIQVASYMGIALLSALLLGTLLSGSNWTLPVDPVAAANFTA
jgi:hypothetical protein